MNEMSSKVIAAVQAATGQNVDSLAIQLRIPSTPQTNRLYDVWADGSHLNAKDYVNENEWATAPLREFQSLHLLAPLDIAPQPVFYDPGIGPVVIYEFMEGAMWGRRRPSAEELAQLAELSAQLHTLPTDRLWQGRSNDQTLASRIVWFTQTFDAYTQWTATAFPIGQQAAKLCRELLALRLTLGEEILQEQVNCCLCRADSHFANVIARENGRLGLVDWEDAGLRDPALDLADLLLHVEQEDLLSRDEWQPFFDVYWQASGQDAAQIIPRMEAYCALLPLFWLAVLIRAGMKQVQTGQLAGWQINEMPANQRLQRYLARGYAWPKWEFDPKAYADIPFFPT
jgi:thiamine kinase-like enzyme